MGCGLVLRSATTHYALVLTKVVANDEGMKRYRHVIQFLDEFNQTGVREANQTVLSQDQYDRLGAENGRNEEVN